MADQTDNLDPFIESLNQRAAAQRPSDQPEQPTGIMANIGKVLQAVKDPALGALWGGLANYPFANRAMATRQLESLQARKEASREHQATERFARQLGWPAEVPVPMGMKPTDVMGALMPSIVGGERGGFYDVPSPLVGGAPRQIVPAAPAPSSGRPFTPQAGAKGMFVPGLGWQPIPAEMRTPPRATGATGEAKPRFVPGVGWLYPPGPSGVAPPPIKVPGMDQPQTPKDLAKSVADDNIKGVRWYSETGQPAPGEWSRAQALKSDYTPMPKDDGVVYSGVLDMANKADAAAQLSPVVAQKLSQFAQKQPRTLLGRYIGARYRAADLNTLAKQDPDASRYVQLLREIGLKEVKAMFAKGQGRLPVWDQQLLLGLTADPSQTPDVQQQKLQQFSSEARRQAQTVLNVYRVQRAEVPSPAQGQLIVRRISDGKFWKITPEEFDPNIYEKVQ